MNILSEFKLFKIVGFDYVRYPELIEKPEKQF